MSLDSPNIEQSQQSRDQDSSRLYKFLDLNSDSQEILETDFQEYQKGNSKTENQPPKNQVTDTNQSNPNDDKIQPFNSTSKPTSTPISFNKEEICHQIQPGDSKNDENGNERNSKQQFEKNKISNISIFTKLCIYNCFQCLQKVVYQ